ncbi:MAG: aminopeptidase P family protein [Candidatus Omnitrophica bacterium]|nr:aminopeptidase P family protein [Candidatus Omnitrophota bacterium]
MKNRIKVVQGLVKKDRLDAFLVFSTINIRYLTGFEGTAGLLLALRDKAILFVDSRYTLKAKKEARGVRIVTVSTGWLGLTNYFDALASHTGLRMGFEEEHLNYKSFRKLSLLLPGVRLCPYTGVIEKQRACKDKKEIAIIRKSIAITEKALVSVSHFIKPGISEKEIADRLEQCLRKQGARGSSFRTIVATPQNASSPHSEPGTKTIPSRGLVLVDIGCDYQGYSSDMTRLFLLNKMKPFEKKIVQIVAESKRKAIGAIREGRSAKDIDSIGRGAIEKAGFGKYFGHGLGHGIGLSVHEEPVISKGSETILKEGMVVTIEPGIYLPGRFGVRLEDVVLVTKKRGVKLTTLPDILKILD